ncbi:MAG TPA: methyltransferase [Anaeromyxobacter sp.]|nr:methyltransferase [Anaeromyxobacter sp.]
MALQAVAAVLVAVAGVWGPAWPARAGPWREIAAFAFGALGAALGVGAGVELGRQTTPLPRPVAGGKLRERGAYGLVRHPMYGGALLLGLAYALATSMLALPALAAAAAFVDLKRRMEEAWLLEEHPAYAGYRRRVRWRMIPFVW